MKRDYFRGNKKPTSDFMGVSALYMRKDNSICWRSHIVLANNKLHIIGTYDSEQEAADAYDEYVVEHKLLKPLNSGSYRSHLTKADKELIDSLYGSVSIKSLAKITSKTLNAIRKYVKDKSKNKGEYSILILDKRENYEE